MRIAPVSADLLIKLGLAALVIGAIVYATRQVKAAGQGIASTVSAAADAVAVGLNPSNPENVVNSQVTAVVTAATGRDETLGGWLYDFTHPDPLRTPAPVTDNGNGTVDVGGQEFNFNF
jgi:hypothetical protein